MNKVSFALPSPPASPGDANAWKAGKGSSVDCSSRSQSNWEIVGGSWESATATSFARKGIFVSEECLIFAGNF